MDAYTCSKMYADWIKLGMTANTEVLTVDNVINVFNTLMLEMSNKRVPATGRILYVTPAVKSLISNSKAVQRNINLKDSTKRLTTDIEGIDLVDIVSVPPELMGTAYDFTQGWVKDAGFKQINMMLIHPSAVITPVKYSFSQLDAPSAGSEGKWIYFEESYEDVFVLKNKKDGIQINVEA